MRIDFLGLRAAQLFSFIEQDIAMRTKMGMVGAALMVLLAPGAQAQVLGTISVSPQSAKAGEPVTVTATIDVISGNYCGFVVSYGDGTNVDGVSNANKLSPFVFTHTYSKAGNYSVTLGGRNVQSHPNCGGGEKAARLTVTAVAAPVAATPAAAVCPDPWKLVAKSRNVKTGAFTCAAKPGTALPTPNPTCPGDLTYFENAKKGQLGCRP